ncbi:MAG: hypothetical protein AB7O45_00275 [Alphaproteobacteria bacterium]
MAAELGVVRRLHDVPKRTAAPSPTGRRRYLVPINDNRAPLPVRLRRPLLLLAIAAILVYAAIRWLG